MSSYAYSLYCLHNTINVTVKCNVIYYTVGLYVAHVYTAYTA